jgi:hypothetical protein
MSRTEISKRWCVVGAAAAVALLGPLGCHSSDPEVAQPVEAIGRALLGDNVTYTCENGACAGGTPALTNFSHMTKLTRIGVRSTAFVQCMQKAMTTGVTFGQALSTFAAPAAPGCGSDPNYVYDGWGPYVGCRPEADPTWGGEPVGAHNNHDGAWNELPDRQLARALTSSQANLDVHHVFAQLPQSGSRQEGLSPTTGILHVRWFGSPNANFDLNSKVGGGNLVGTLLHESMHDLGYDHGCFGTPPPSGTAGTNHGNCGRDFRTWNPNRSMNNIAGFCVQEVLQRSRRATNAGCADTGAGAAEDLATCVGGRMLISRFLDAPGAAVACHCVPDSSGFADNAGGDQFGAAVAVGDFNGDGFPDLAVGSAGEKLGGTSVLVFRGSPIGLRPWQSFTDDALGFVGEVPSTCGSALAAGDFNHDGAADLAVGCPSAEIVSVLPGCRLGTACPGGQDGLARAQHLVLHAAGNDGSFGVALAAGDFTNDGIDDLAVGIPAAPVLGVVGGMVDVKQGHSSGTMLTDLVTIQGLQVQNGMAFGVAVAFGNVFGGAEKELVIGAPNMDSLRGAVFVAHRASSGLVDVQRLAVGSTLSTAAAFGRSVAAGNVTGSSFDDVVVGAPGTRTVYVAAGASGSPSQAFPAFTSQYAEAGLALAVVSPGTFAGFADTIVGAPGSDRVLRIDGGSGGTLPFTVVSDRGQPLWSASHDPGDGRRGNCPKCCNDPAINSDELCPFDELALAVDHPRLGQAVALGNFGLGPQIVAGAPSDVVDPAPAVSAGSAYVLEGGAAAQEVRLDQVGAIFGGAPPAQTRLFFGGQSRWHDFFCVGSQQCRLADVNGDGRADLVVFVRDATPGQEGDVWVALASAGGVFGTPQKWHDAFCFGQQQCEVGDVNGDHRADIVVFTADTTPGQQGDIWVALNEDPATLPPGTLPLGVSGRFRPAPQRWHDFFCVGQQVCQLGDVNGDGKLDAVAFVRDATPGQQGDVWVSLSNGSSFEVQPRKAHDFFCVGQQQCALGDVNGDGKADAILFTRDTTPGQQGDVWVALSDGLTFGAPLGAPQKWHDSFCLGQQVCAVGDVNGDGRADVVTFIRDATAGQLEDIWVGLSNGRDFGPPQKWHDQHCRANEICALADVDGDRRADAVRFVGSSAGEPALGDVWVALSGR